jgi:hypothetical protein
MSRKCRSGFLFSSFIMIPYVIVKCCLVYAACVFFLELYMCFSELYMPKAALRFIYF